MTELPSQEQHCIDATGAYVLGSKLDRIGGSFLQTASATGRYAFLLSVCTMCEVSMETHDSNCP